MTNKLFIPIKYHTRNYPQNIVPKYQEVAGHFDILQLKNTENEISLHTEYSYGKREFNNPVFDRLLTLKSCQKDGVPQLWVNEKWAVEFSEFIDYLLKDNNHPKIIEVHPPFNDYCLSIQEFLDVFKIFEDRILELFPDVVLLVENRCGSMYRGGKFLISKTEHLIQLAEEIYKRGLRLRITLDFPQLFSANGSALGLTTDEVDKIINPLKKVTHCVDGVHLWGKRKNQDGRVNSHIGDLNSYFENEDIKKHFLEAIGGLFNDGKSRYFVPEVNSNDEDVASIVNDLMLEGFEFT